VSTAASPSGAVHAPCAGRVERDDRDDMVMVEVLTETFDRAWWRHYARTLAERFAQDEIHIRALTVETP